MRFLFEMAIGLIVVIIIALAVIRMMPSRQFSKEVSDLFAYSKSISEKIFSYEQAISISPVS
jgi:hypothetical protein